MNYKLLLNTLVHLKPTQAVHQVKNRLYKPKFERFEVFDPSTGSGTGLGGSKWLVEPIPRPCCTEGDKFTFINIPSEFMGWNDSSRGMLWAYNQNYFDFINEEGKSKEYGLYWIDKFIEEIPSNKVGLDPYPIALRGINWIKFFRRYPETMTKERIDSLYSQYKLLQKKLEYHLLGNHLLEDFYSLFIMSLFFGDKKYHQWVARKLIDELDEEILKDGGHFEQSVMYHCILLDRLLDCINLASGMKSLKSSNGKESTNSNLSNISNISGLKQYASKMLGWLEAICYEDGSFPLFNDAALGIAPTPKEIFDYALRLNIEWSKAELDDSGYRSLNNHNGIEVRVDVGNITATYQAGHTHADTFNFELRVDGLPFVVDTGISTYNKTARRQYERSTEAHNTVTIDGKNSSEVWGGFRVGKRARVCGDVCKTACGDIHNRSFQIIDEALIVCDSVNVPAVSRIHLAQEIVVAKDNIECHDVKKGVYVIMTNMGSIKIAGATNVVITDCQIAREYNRLIDAKVVEISFDKDMSYMICK